MTLNWSIQPYDSVTSTQDVLKDAATDGADEGLVVQAGEQTRGRGRHGRVWTSEPGNLYMSILLRPDCEAALVGELALLAGVAIAEAMAPDLANTDVLRLKWPNDVLLDGRKCAGLLLESDIDSGGRITWLALGMGVNIAHAPEGGAVMQAASVDALRDRILDTLGRLYRTWQGDGFAPIRTAWLGYSFPKGTDMSVKSPSGRIEGKFESIDDSGNLLIRVGEAGDLRTITAGDVHATGR